MVLLTQFMNMAAPVGADPMQILWQIQQPAAITLLLILLGLTFPVRGLLFLIVGCTRGIRPSRTTVILCVAEVLLGTAILCLARISAFALYIILAVYLSFLLAAKGIDCYIYAKARQWRCFIPAAATTSLGTQLLFLLLTVPPAAKQKILLLLSLLMLTVFGTSLLCDILFFFVKSGRFRRVLNHIRVALPDYVGLPLPLQASDAAKTEFLSPVPPEKIEVLFQVSRKGIGIAGHCELCIDGRTLTYGCYEPESRRLFSTMGRGVIFRAPRDEYLQWSMRENDKKVISYTLQFPPEQMALVRRQLSLLEENLEAWQPQEAPEEYITRVQQVQDVRIYRVTGGPFRTYFVPTINCVTITNSILGKTELGRALMPGIKTPGAYMDMLDRQYYAGSSVVVERHTYGPAEKR